MRLQEDEAAALFCVHVRVHARVVIRASVDSCFCRKASAGSLGSMLCCWRWMRAFLVFSVHEQQHLHQPDMAEERETHGNGRI